MHAAALPEHQPDWSTWEAARNRTRFFLILAGFYVGFQIVARWVEYPLFRADNYFYFNNGKNSIFELGYRWVLSFLPLAFWGFAIYFLLTRFRFLTHRRVAYVVILAGLTYFEADMRWFTLSKKHVTWTEIQVLFTIDATNGLGLRESDYQEFLTLTATHAIGLLICLLLSGPELRAVVHAILEGPFRATYLGMACRRLLPLGARVIRWARADRVFRCLTGASAACVLAGLFLLDPVIIWYLDKQEQDLEESRSVIREIAETNPLRMHFLDRWWEGIVHRFSEQSQDLAAANLALQQVDAAFPAIAGSGHLFLSKARPAPAQPENVIFIQIESLNAAAFEQAKLPFLSEFSKKCLRLKRHSSSGNCTHYGILGLLHGNPVTFFHGKRQTPIPCAYLKQLADNGYKSRVISMRIMDHHHLGEYVPNWTEPVYEAGMDSACIPEFQKEIVKPGPRFVYLFYNFTHYPYRHEEQYSVHQPEVPYEFAYNRSDLILYRDQIINRYKNALLEMDDWVKGILEKVDLSKTIVVINGDHGEELLAQGRLGHCSSLNVHQTITPCLVHIPGIEPADVLFPTSHADMMPTVADALGWKTKPDVLGRSLFEPVPIRYSIVSNFEYAKALRWAILTEDRKAIVERGADDCLTITSLVDWEGRGLTFRDQPERWMDNFRVIRKLESELIRYSSQRSQ